MVWYKRLIFDVFRGRTSPVESFVSRSIISQPMIFRNSGLQSVVTKAKRFYDADRNKPGYRRWYADRRRKSIGFVGFCGVLYYWNLETVPYSNRRHFVIVPSCIEKKIGELCYELYKSDVYEGKVLGADHPHSIRAEKIGQDIIGGLRRALTMLDDDKLTAHFNEINWEIIVVDEPSKVNCGCFPGGKIIVFTGLFKVIKTDAELAIVFGHEVGHTIARHSAENLSGVIWVKILQFFVPDKYKTTTDPFLWLPIRRRNEKEADYIGMIISASAGYDPRIAPEVYKKLDIHPEVSDVDADRHTHPPGKKRAELLSQPKVMDEALAIYREALKDKEKDIIQSCNLKKSN